MARPRLDHIPYQHGDRALCLQDETSSSLPAFISPRRALSSQRRSAETETETDGSESRPYLFE